MSGSEQKKNWRKEKRDWKETERLRNQRWKRGNRYFNKRQTCWQEREWVKNARLTSLKLGTRNHFSNHFFRSLLNDFCQSFSISFQSLFQSFSICFSIFFELVQINLFFCLWCFLGRVFVVVRFLSVVFVWGVFDFVFSLVVFLLVVICSVVSLCLM